MPDLSGIVVVVDKLRLKSTYPTPWHPYHLALGFMLQRYCGYLNHISGIGDVMAEARGGTENRLLSDEYRDIYQYGDRFHKSGWYKATLTSGKLKLKPKSQNIAGLQLADLLAHPVKMSILEELGLLARRRGGFGDRLAREIEPKYNRHLYTGKIEGYGKILFPK